MLTLDLVVGGDAHQRRVDGQIFKGRAAHAAVHVREQVHREAVPVALRIGKRGFDSAQLAVHAAGGHQLVNQLRDAGQVLLRVLVDVVIDHAQARGLQIVLDAHVHVLAFLCCEGMEGEERRSFRREAPRAYSVSNFSPVRSSSLYSSLGNMLG